MTSLLGTESLNVIAGILRELGNVPGDIVELGVYRGGCSALMARTLPGRRLHLFDTFTGLPPCDPAVDGNSTALEVGRFAVSAEEVLASLPGGTDAVCHVGEFPATCPATLAPIAFAHLDCDLYWPTLHALRLFYPVLSPGGAIVCDDASNGCTPGVLRALEASGLPFTTNAYNQAIIRKAA